MAAPPFVIIGNATSRRVDLFQAALVARGCPPARLVQYIDLIEGRVALPDVVQAGAVLRIESPGKDADVERLLLCAGAEAAATEPFDCIERTQAQRLVIEKGRLLFPRQWYLGFCAVLAEIERQRATCPAHTLMNHPADIAVMFDKRLTHARMQSAGIAVPRGLGPVASYNELVDAMRRERCARVFIKLAHGSSATGVVAYQVSGSNHMATTTVDMVRAAGELRLYNSRRLRTYRDPQVIAELIDTLCRQCVHVEQWLPKAGFDGRTCDLRVVVLAGEVRHVVVRLSRSPLTNLHLLNERGDRDALLARMGVDAWASAQDTCRRAMACFPQSCYGGIDLLIQPGFRRHAVLEVNAFGDLLPGVLDQGEDTYQAAIRVHLTHRSTAHPQETI